MKLPWNRPARSDKPLVTEDELLILKGLFHSLQIAVHLKKQRITRLEEKNKHLHETIERQTKQINTLRHELEEFANESPTL